MVDIVSGPFDLGDTDGDRVFTVSDFPLRSVQQLRFDEDDRIVVPDCALQQALCIVRRSGRDHFQSRHVAEPGLQTLRMLRA